MVSLQLVPLMISTHKRLQYTAQHQGQQQHQKLGITQHHPDLTVSGHVWSH